MVMAIQAIIYFVLLPTWKTRLALFDFFILVTITVLMAASGYVINDYYDHDTDRINKPAKWIAGNTWPLALVLKVYFLIVGIGFVLSIFLASRLGLMHWILLYPGGVVGLWLYSYVLKCRPIAGNLWVSFFCAAVVLIVAMPDWLLHNGKIIRPELWGYAAFAFLTTWYREMVKDMEDVRGDNQIHCQTFVVRYGVRAGKLFSLVLGAGLLLALIWWDSLQHNRTLHLGLLVLQGAVVGSIAFVWWAKNHSYFTNASTLIKVVMAVGTGLLLFL